MSTDPVGREGASNSRIESLYTEKTERSAALAEEARGIFPGGVTHDSRLLKPHGIYIDTALGSRKWDVDGNQYVDYFGGHGALLLGHGREEVLVEATKALARGTQFAAGQEYEIRWGRLVQEMVPSAERVRFTSSGTEATHLAFRLARYHSGKSKLVRFRSHFHGWHDHMAHGVGSHFDGSPAAGVSQSVTEQVILVDPGDLDRVAAAISGGDVAAVIIEPTGASMGFVTLPQSFLQDLRDLTAKTGTVLIFDEVVTGFRVSPGGAQAVFDILPDLTTLAKVLAGGLPGGAVAGRKDILDAIDPYVAAELGKEKIGHHGTFNANPVSAAAGSTALEIIRDTPACADASNIAEVLRDALNSVLLEEKLPWAVFGTYSMFHLFADPNRPIGDPTSFDPSEYDYSVMKDRQKELIRKYRLAMLIGGVDLNSEGGGLTSAVHSMADVEWTVAAFRAAIQMLREEGEIA